MLYVHIIVLKVMDKRTITLQHPASGAARMYHMMTLRGTMLIKGT